MMMAGGKEQGCFEDCSRNDDVGFPLRKINPLGLSECIWPYRNEGVNVGLSVCAVRNEGGYEVLGQSC